MTPYAENLERLARSCPQIREKLESADESIFQFCRTERREVNLYEARADEKVFLHDQAGALEEAKQWFEHNAPIGCRFDLVFGIGLGYYYDAAKEWLKGDPHRVLIFIEDNPAILKRFLETEKASGILKDPQVIVHAFDMPEENGWGRFREQFDWFFRVFAFENVYFSCLALYNQTRKELFDLIVKQILMNKMDQEIRRNDIMVQAREIASNWYHNAAQLAGSGLMASLYGSLKGVPAIICGAGPSLAKQIPLLKNLSNKALIIGSGTGMNVLNKNGVFPHMGIAIDPFPDQESRFMTNYAWETPFIYGNRFYWPAFNAMHGPKACVLLLTFRDFPDWLQQRLNLPKEPAEFQGLSTTNIAVYTAWALGCDPIILAGVDLAYTESARYASGAAGHPLNERKMLESYKKTTDRPIPIKGADGSEIMTKWEWVLEAAQFTDFSHRHPGLLVNATEGGMPIYQVPNISLEKSVEKYFQKNYSVHAMLHAAIEESKQADIKEEDVLQALTEWGNSLKKSIELCKEAELAILKTKQEMKGEFYPSEKTKEAEAKLLEEPAYKFLLYGFDKVFPDLVLLDTRKIACFSDIYTPEQLSLIQAETLYNRFSALQEYAKLQLQCLQEALSSRSLFNKLMALNESEEDKQAYNDLLKEGSKARNNDKKVLFCRDDSAGKEYLFYAAGGLYACLKYNQAVKNGEQRYFYPDGIRKSILNFKNGALDGSVELFYPNGSRKRTLHFKEGKLHGIEHVWNPAGQLILEAEFKENLPVNKSRQWHPNGQLAKEIVFYDNPMNYDSFEYDAAGNLLKKKVYVPENPLQGIIDQSNDLKQSISGLTERIEQLKALIEKQKQGE